MNWSELWNGAAGSFLAAVLGGLVALCVVRSTNKQQEREGSKARQIAAIADMVVALDELVRIKSEVSRRNLEDSVNQLQGAAARLHMDLPKGGLRTELRRSLPALHRFVERPDGADEFAAAVGVLRFELMKWPSASKTEKKEIEKTLIKTRAKYEEAWRSVPVPVLEVPQDI